MKINKEKEVYPAFQKKNIPIVFSSDDNYCPYLGVAIKSLTKNSSDKNNYDILILNEKISINNKEKIFSLIKNLDNFSIRFINVKEYIKKPEIFHINTYFSIATYYRLFLEKICDNYQKVIFLDCDIIILDDIAKLLRVELKNNLFGAVIIPENLKDENQKKYINKILKIPDDSKYFNTGVLVIDIQNITKFKLFQKAITSLKKIKKPRFVDQDILNTVCFGKVKFINPKYNHFAGFSKKNNKEFIIHYVINKPWQDSKVSFSNLFWKYAKLTPFYKEIINNNTSNPTSKKNSNLRSKLIKFITRIIPIHTIFLKKP
jgi:lipopolysaccharide biosynthesis glycosyltransferase